MLAVYSRIAPHKTLCYEGATKKHLFSRLTASSGGLLEVCQTFYTYPAEENGEWGSFAWLKPVQMIYFPRSSRELVFRLPLGWPHKSRRGTFFCWLIRNNELIVKRGACRCGSWSFLLLPSFVPRRSDPDSRDRRRLTFPVQGYHYR
jgi:hypothetical protein